jgi:hypothetical protein
VVGPIWSEGAWDGRSTARWQEPAVVGSPVRLPGVIGERGWVRCAREGTVKLKNNINWART